MLPATSRGEARASEAVSAQPARRVGRYGRVNRKHLSLAALAVVLVALGVALLPFSWRDPYKARVDCSPAVLAAWEHTGGGFAPTLGATQAHGAGSLPSSGISRSSGPTPCAKKARTRLETSGVLLVLTGIGLVAGRRILRPESLALVG